MPGVAGRSGGHNRKLTKEHKTDGTYREGRHGDRLDLDQKPIGKVQPPESLGPVGIALWNKTVNAIGEKCLTDSHLEALETYSRTWELLQDTNRILKDDPVDKDTRIAWKTYVDTMDKLGRQFGWTPLAAAAIKVPGGEGEKKSAFEQWLEQNKEVN